MILRRNDDVNEDDVKHLVKELGYDVKQFDDPTEKKDKRFIIHKKNDGEFLFTNDDFKGIAKLAQELYKKINP